LIQILHVKENAPADANDREVRLDDVLEGRQANPEVRGGLFARKQLARHVA
jgi:hypothetical protein